jgi:hypothetical protein
MVNESINIFCHHIEWEDVKRFKEKMSMEKSVERMYINLIDQKGEVWRV